MIGFNEKFHAESPINGGCLTRAIETVLKYSRLMLKLQQEEGI